MSQQINLLVQERSASSSALPLLAGLGVMLVLLLGYWQLARMETAKASAAATRSEQQLLAAKAALQAMQQELAAQQKNQDVAQEIAELKVRAGAAQEITDRLQKGELGNTVGYYNYLSGLARISEEGLWLTSVAIGNAGKNVNIAGRALQSEAVLQYARKLNAQFSTYGVQFNSIEMAPEVFSKEGAATLSTVSFKLF